MADVTNNTNLIRFFSQHIPFSLNKKEEVKAWILSVIRKEKKKAGNISFIFCNDKFLLSLNKKFLKHNTLTDIITFDYSSPVPHSASLTAEIFISIPRVKENANFFEVSFENELHRVMIHGILHLCGYTDKTPGKKKQMRKREDMYLKMYGRR